MRTSAKTKQIIYQSKGIGESYPKMYFFIEFEPLCQKLWAFMSIFGIFYDAHSPNMAMSRGPRSKFQKKLFFPNSALNIRKSYKISSRKVLYFKRYQPKTSRGGGWKTPPSAFRVKECPPDYQITPKNSSAAPLM